MKPKKIGIALSGGSARGLAHIGVIKTLIRAGIKIDYIAGTSMGALVGGLYAATLDINFVERLFLKIADDFSSSKFNLRIPLIKSGDIFKNREKMEKLIFEPIRDLKIEELKIPAKFIATDVDCGDEVVLEKGSLEEAIRASAAIPFLFEPVLIDGKLLMDGGFVNPIPVDRAREMGAQFVIASNVLRNWPKNIKDEKLNLHNLRFLLMETLTALEYEVSKRNIAKADIVISSPVLDYKWNDFAYAAEIIEKGQNETERYIADIRKFTHHAPPPKKPLEAFIDFITGNDL
jgi:NTE family protein